MKPLPCLNKDESGLGFAVKPALSISMTSSARKPCLSVSALIQTVLLLGPVQALGLTRDVEEAQSVASTAPAEAAGLYALIAQSLRGQFPGYADRFEKLRAASLKAAGNSDASHDLIVKIAIQNLFEQAEPQLSADVEHSLEGFAQGSRRSSEGTRGRPKNTSEGVTSILENLRNSRSASTNWNRMMSMHPSLLHFLPRQRLLTATLK